MRQFTFAMMLAMLFGSTAMAQTTAERKANLKAFIDSRSDTQTLAVEDALVSLGYVKLSEPPPPPPTTDRLLVWSTTHETNNISTWNFGRTAIYNSGNGVTQIREISNAKSGRYALYQQVYADGSSGARCFITGDKDNKPIPKKLYMTAWLYLPKAFKVGDWWNHMQLKERPSIGGSPVNPTLHLSLATDSQGRMYQRIYNWIAGQKVYYNQDAATRVYLPIGKWTKIEWYVDSRTSGGSTWLKQDDKLIIERTGIKTISSDSYVLNWSVNAYGGSGPGQVTYYWDDCTLETPK